MQRFTLLAVWLMISTLSTQAQKLNYLTENITITSLADDGRYLWAATENGVMRLEKSNKRTLIFNTQNSQLPVNWVTSIAVDTSGAKWMGTHSGLVHYNDVDWRVFTTENSAIPENMVLDVETDREGKVWLVTGSGHLASWDGSNWWTNDLKNLVEGAPKLLVASPFGTYIATQANKVYEYLQEKDSVRWIGNISSTINTLEVSPEAKLLIGIDGRLIEFGNGISTIYESPYKTPEYNVNDIDFSSNGDLWMGTTTGLAKYRNNRWQLYDRKYIGLSKTNILSVVAGDKNVHYLGTDHGVLMITDSTGRPENSVYVSMGMFGDYTTARIHYERLTPISGWLLLTSGIGIGTEREWDFAWGREAIAFDPYGIIPAHIGILLGGKRLFMEYALQGIFVGGENPAYRFEHVYGFRIQPKHFKRILFRMNLTKEIGGFGSGLNLSLGVAF